MRNKYRGPLYEQYRPARREDLKSDTMCLWCESAPAKKAFGMWCTREHQAQYQQRAKFEELRFAVQDRDVNHCEACGKVDSQYMIAPRFPVEYGGGAGGIDSVRTLCEQCFLLRADEITLQELRELFVPDVRALRNAWRGSKRRWESLRYALGPAILSGLRWLRVITDYQEGSHHLAREASRQTQAHFRMTQLSLRWWSIVRKNSHNEHPLLVLTVDSLQKQMRACAVWSIHFRYRQMAPLD